MKHDFSDYVQTLSGYPIKEVRFNSIPGLWLGLVKDPKSSFPDRFVTCSWSKSGKCTNGLRPDLNLK
jgi:hypothetical protein